MTSLEAVYRVANFCAVIGWIVLVLAAMFGWRRALTRFCGTLVPLLLAAAYLVLLVTHWGGSQVDFTSLTGVAALFRQPATVLAGWLHFLAFDLLVGVMVVDRFLDDRMPRILLLPVIPLVFFFGPVGWLAFQAIRFARRDGPTAPPRPAPSRAAAKRAPPRKIPAASE